MTNSEPLSQSNIDSIPTVSPCCCCPMTYREFYSFINISDIIGCIIGLIIAFVLALLNFSVSLVAIILTVVWLITSIVALCMFKSKKDYRTGFHKFYSVLRGLIAFLDILFMILLLSHVINGDLHEKIEDLRVLLIIIVIILLVLSCFNMYWSVLFLEIVFSSKKGSPNVSELKSQTSNVTGEKSADQNSVDPENQENASPIVN